MTATSSKSLESILANEQRKNKILQEVSTVLGTISPLQNKLHLILELLYNQFDLHHTMILFPDALQENLEVFASKGLNKSGIGAKSPFGIGVIGVVAAKRKKLRIAGISQSKMYANFISKQQKEKSSEINELPGLVNVEAQLAIPLISNNELVAVLSAESDRMEFFTEEDEDFLMTISQQIALSIQNSLLFDNLERKVVERTKELKAANTTKDRFFSVIGHDLRSPLAALEGVSELINYYNKKGDTEKVSSLGEKISVTAQNVNKLLDNLLNWSLSQKGEITYNPEVIELKPLIREVEDLFLNNISAKEIKYTCDLSDDILIMADRNMVFSIIRNLLSNSIKFTPTGETIDLKTEIVNDAVLITLQDSGVGISKDKIDKLFTFKDKKSTLGTNREKGTGLGLVLVKEFVEMNKGSITFESQEHRGTTVRLVLPSA